jgi:hypothetical protein
VQQHRAHDGAGQQHRVDERQQVAQQDDRPQPQRLAAVGAGEGQALPAAQAAQRQRQAQEVDPEYPATEVQAARHRQQRADHRDAVQEQKAGVEEQKRRQRQDGVEHVGQERHVGEVLGPGAELHLDTLGQLAVEKVAQDPLEEVPRSHGGDDRRQHHQDHGEPLPEAAEEAGALGVQPLRPGLDDVQEAEEQAGGDEQVEHQGQQGIRP